jgi:hypothetical protein
MKERDLGSELSRALEPVHIVLQDLAERARALQTDGRFGRSEIDGMAAALEPAAAAALAGTSSGIVGVGIVWEAGTSTQEDSGLLWWRADAGELARKAHVHNPASDSYYDFRNSEWYRRALAASSLAVTGPYIDAWGTDDHALTPSLVIADEQGKIIGVAAVDLDLTVTTARLAAVLEPFGDVVLLNSDEQIVAANHPLLSPGLRLEPFLARTGLTATERTPLSVDGWEIAELH